ncbi:MAG: HAD family phosphatase [Candidatus Diapherotrites archaeon]
MLKAVLFDMDGVIVDTMHLHSKATDFAFSSLGIAEQRHLLKKFGALPTEEAIKRAFPEKSLEEVSLIVDLKYKKLKELASELIILPGFLDFFKKVSVEFKTALVSNSSRDFVEYVVSKLPDFVKFDVIISSSDVVNGKPDPECYLKAAEFLGLNVYECVVIEDSLVGIVAGKAAGMKVVAVETTHDKIFLQDADLIVRSLQELSVSSLLSLFSKKNF